MHEEMIAMAVCALAQAAGSGQRGDMDGVYHALLIARDRIDDALREMAGKDGAGQWESACSSPN